MSSLERASKHLNNLLLARGLLHNGQAINFAHPAQSVDGLDMTMVAIANLVHSLLVRRDRESEQNEAMAASIRKLRATESQRAVDIQHAQDRNQQLKNDAVTAQAQERSIRITLKKMESQIKDLKEQNLKMKSMLDQVRAKCTSDVKKRDAEIEKLKSHLVGLQRGKKDTGGMRINALNMSTASAGQERRRGQNVNSTGWSLGDETNDFLAALVNETSAENVSLRQIVEDTLHILRDMSGMESKPNPLEVDGIGIPGQYRKSRHNDTETITPVHEMAEEMEKILQICKTIMKDPSFVPIEEVQARDEEIIKLRAGWDRMADRWKEAVTMMDQWKQNLAVEGDGAGVSGLSNLSFGRSVATRPDGQPVFGQDSELSSIFEEYPAGGNTLQTTKTDDSVQTESDLELETEPPTKRIASSPAKRGVRLTRASQPLYEIDGNNASIHAFKSEVEAGKSEVSHNLGNRKRKASGIGTANQKSAYRRSTISPADLAETVRTN